MSVFGLSNLGSQPSRTLISETNDVEFTIDDWSELIATMRPGGPAVFGRGDRSEATLVGLIPARKINSALRKILGYSIGSGLDYRLYRPELPWAHPKYPWLWATGVAVDERSPCGNPDNFYDGFKPQPNTPNPSPFIPSGPNRTGNYQDTRLSIRFEPRTWAALADNDPNFIDPNYVDTNGNIICQEWKRFLGLSHFEPSLDVVTADSGTDSDFLYFAETVYQSNGSQDPSAPTPGGPSSSGTPWAAPVSVYKQMSKYVLLWHCVEESYLFTNTFPLGDPTRLLWAMGSVNSVPFPGPNGHPAGTLLFEAPRGLRYQLPVQVADANGNLSPNGLWAWDIELTLSKFDPKRGAVDPTTMPPYPIRGHNLFPWRGDLNWYMATRGQDAGKLTANAAPLLRYTDFHDVFRHVNDPINRPPTWTGGN